MHRLLHRALVALLLLLSTALVGGPAAARPDVRAPRTATVVDLGGLGGTASLALGVTESGTVVGTARTGTASRPQHAVRWDDGIATDLGTLPGSTFSRAFAANDRGDAVGEAFTAPPESSRAVLWRDGEVVELGSLGNGSGVANDVDARGRVVGTSSLAGGPVRAFLWERGSMREVGTFVDSPTATSRGHAISDRGHVVGSASSASGATHAYLATPRGRRGHAFTDLGSLDGPSGYSVAHGVNERGVVVGESAAGTTPTGSTVYRAFRWQDGTLTDLGTVAGLAHSRANDVNARGDVAGHATGFVGFASLDGRAVVWRDGGALDLNELLPPGSGWVLRSAEAISDRGVVVGYGTRDGENRAFLLRLP